ncbi:hypothetical protein N665_0297s0009 [Sinapis alba]|nr:hypothetical protein N665_0297s0009 [Sinapis alba]
MYEDNAACIAQLKDGYIKGDRTKHILPKFFFTHDLQKNGDIRFVQVRSSDNLADLFTKALPTATFKKLVHLIGLRRFKDLDVLEILYDDFGGIWDVLEPKKRCFEHKSSPCLTTVAT